MDLAFLKLRVCDSDLILVDDREGRTGAGDWPRVARDLLGRRRGVGALRLAVMAGNEGDIWLKVYDGEGGEDAALFDAALCAARYLHDSGLAGAETLRFRSGTGELAVDILDGSSLGMALGPLLSVPEGLSLATGLAEERKAFIEAGGESFEILPAALARVSARRGGPALPPGDGGGPRAVVVFCAGGSKVAKARIAPSGGRGRPPSALPVRILSRAELRIGSSSDPRLDAVSRAALGFGAAVLARHADDEALVRSGSGALWAEMTADSRLYVAGRPDYVFRGDFPIEAGARGRGA